MESQTVPGTAGYTGGGATAMDEHGVKTGKEYKGIPDCCKGIHACHGGAGGPSPDDMGAPATGEHGVITGKAHPGSAGEARLPSGSGAPAPQTGIQADTVPATAGYSGGGATVIDDHGVKTGKEYQGNPDCCQGIHACHGGAGGPSSHYDEPAGTHGPAGTQGAPTGSVIGTGAGANQPVQVMPSEAPKGEITTTEKAKLKTAAMVAGVQEDLHGLRQRLTGTKVGDAASEGHPSDAPTGAQGTQQQSGWKDKATNIAVKAIDKGQGALEGAKQRVTGATTQPVLGQTADPAGKHAAQGAQPMSED